MLGLLGFNLLLWGYLSLGVEIEFPETHVDGLLVCLPEDNSAPGGLSEEIFNDELAIYREEFENKLSAAQDPNERVMGLVQYGSMDQARMIVRLAELAAAYPNNRLANLRYLDACSVAADYAECDTERVEEAHAVNAGNSISWSLLAVYRHAIDDVAGVDHAMALAADAPEFDDYFTRQLQIMRDAMPPGSDTQRMGLAWDLIGRGHLLLNNSYQVSYLCDDNNSLRIARANACLEFGRRMQNESQSRLMVLVGSGIQQVAYTSLGNLEEAMRLEEEYLADQQRRSEVVPEWHQINGVSSLLAYDAGLTLFWLNSLIENGETDTAMLNTIAEARRLSADPAYSPCRSPGIRISYR